MKKRLFLITLTLCTIFTAVGITINAISFSDPKSVVDTEHIDNTPVIADTEPIEEINPTEPATESSSEITEQTTISKTEIDTKEIQNEKANDLSDSIIDQSYLGLWFADIYHGDDIMIYEINSDSIKFHSGVFRHFGFDGTAVKCNNGEFRFGEDTQDSPFYPGMAGHLIFDNNGITLIYDSFGVFDDDYSYLKKEYHFTIKDENSDYYVNFKNAMINHQYDEVHRLSDEIDKLSDKVVD